MNEQKRSRNYRSLRVVMNIKVVVLHTYQSQEWYGNEDHSEGRWKNKGAHEVVVYAATGSCSVPKIEFQELAFQSNKFWRGINPSKEVVVITDVSRKRLVKGYEPYLLPNAYELSLKAECSEYEAHDALSYIFGENYENL